MATVVIDFIPPNELPDLTKLHILESSDPDGPFSEIEVVTPVGSQGAYITTYETTLATSTQNWFAIQWESAKGALTDLTEAVQGGTRTAVGEIVSRVLLRDPSANEEVAAQEAATALELVYGTTDVPRTSISNRKMSGLVLLTLASTQLFTLTGGSSSGSSWTAGLVSMKTDTNAGQASLSNIQALLKEASRMLGLSVSRIAQMIPPEIALGLSEIVSADISRLQIEVE